RPIFDSTQLDLIFPRVRLKQPRLFFAWGTNVIDDHIFAACTQLLDHIAADKSRTARDENRFAHRSRLILWTIARQCPLSHSDRRHFRETQYTSSLDTDFPRPIPRRARPVKFAPAPSRVSHPMPPSQCRST